MTQQNVKAPASADARALRNVDQLGRLISSERNRRPAANQGRRLRYWRDDGSTDVATNGTATATTGNGAGAEQARKRRRSFARAITATEFADARVGKLTLDTYRGGR